MSGSSVHVIGATGRSGEALCRALVTRGTGVVAVVRNADKWRQTGIDMEARVADIGDPTAMLSALAGASRIVSAAHARYAQAILAAAPPGAQLVLLGSTRRYTKWPDEHARGVIAGEGALLASGRRGVMLHPTMIYGAAGENNVQRLASLLRKLPLVPLPGGGSALVQPIHQDDLTSCILAALDREWPVPRTLVVAGPEPVSYADLVRAVARAAGLPPPRIVPLPATLLMALAPLAGLLRVMPSVGRAEIRRLLEDKAFSVADMSATLGVQPKSLDDGLARTFRQGDRRCP